MAALKGLAPVSVLSHTTEGQAALGANYTVTGGFQAGKIRQATLLPFAEQQQQALRDVAITSDNLEQLADGLGTTLGASPVAQARCIDHKRFTSLSKNVADLIAFEKATSSGIPLPESSFANATTAGKASVSADALAVLKEIGGDTDVFGRNYGRPAGTTGADAYGKPSPLLHITRELQFELAEFSGARQTQSARI